MKKSEIRILLGNHASFFLTCNCLIASRVQVAAAFQTQTEAFKVSSTMIAGLDTTKESQLDGPNLQRIWVQRISPNPRDSPTHSVFALLKVYNRPTPTKLLFVLLWDWLLIFLFRPITQPLHKIEIIIIITDASSSRTTTIAVRLRGR